MKEMDCVKAVRQTIVAVIKALKGIFEVVENCRKCARCRGRLYVLARFWTVLESERMCMRKSQHGLAS